MRLRTLTALCLLYITGTAQVKPLSSLPAFDCSQRYVMSILARPSIILYPDEHKTLQPIIDGYCSAFGKNGLTRTAAQMNDTDYNHPVFIIGDLHSIKNWSKLKIPIKPIQRGFSINNQAFTDSTDAFIYIDSHHIVLSGNSHDAIKAADLAFTGGYDLIVLQKGKITYIGNYKGNHFDWYNVQDLKKTNYREKQSGSFGHIYLSKAYPDTIDFTRTEASLQKYINQFRKIYNLPQPAKKADWCIHANMQEYGILSGMFWFTCAGNSSAGFSIRGEIHTRGYNIGLVKHEYSHYLFDNSIPQDHNPAFFVEGSVEYVTALNDSATYRERINTAKQYRDTLNYEDLIVKNKDFYGQYSATNYSVCGIFVKYLVDRYGVDSFKAYCLAADKQTATKAVFNQEFKDLITGYKQWLDGH